MVSKKRGLDEESNVIFEKEEDLFLVKPSKDKETEENSENEDEENQDKNETDQLDDAVLSAFENFYSGDSEVTKNDKDVDPSEAIASSTATDTFAKEVESSKNEDDDGDTSDEEDMRNTVGNIPMKWYDDFDHIGYDLDGNKITKPIRNQDELDKFLQRMEDENFGTTIYDEKTGRDHVLTEDEKQLIDRVKGGEFHDPAYNPYEPYVDFFTHETEIHPINRQPEHKRSFVPSKLEAKKIGRMVNAIKMGWIKPRKPKPAEDEFQFYDLWADSDKDKKLTHREQALQKMHIPAPKEALPSHEASYNPPEEYLLTKEEIEKLKEDEKLEFIPKKYDCLRRVPQYPEFIQERFSRNLDLYLCPRQRKMKVHVDAEDLIPELPKPSTLRPFPTSQAMCYTGHETMIRSISVDSTGQWLASGSDDGHVYVWEVATGRCLRKITTLDKDTPVKSVSWCPNSTVCILAVVIGKKIVLINPAVGDKLVTHATDNLFKSYIPTEEEEGEDSTTTGEDGEKVKKNAVIPPWKDASVGGDYQSGQRVIINHPKDVGKLSWHGKGDYFACTVPGNGHAQVILHQLTKRRSQNPFTKFKGKVQCLAFHPSHPTLFVATQQSVRVYDLIKQELTRKLMGNTKWISSISIHPGGNNLIIGTYDSRLSWFDLELSAKPYMTLRYHKKAIRGVCYHKKYPLFASGSDDATVIVSHGMVYNDLLQNPLIVPVKVLRGHKVAKNVGVLDVTFHPTQPWVFSSAADKTIRLFT